MSIHKFPQISLSELNSVWIWKFSLTLPCGVHMLSKVLEILVFKCQKWHIKVLFVEYMFKIIITVLYNAYKNREF